MERNEIQLLASQMETRSDLVELLNKVKCDMLGGKAHPFQLRQITYYCNPKRSNIRRYVEFTILKKSGGLREISAPVRGLKSILFSLNAILQAIYTPSKFAMGFAQGRSVVDNAKVHVGQRYIYNIDLKDFFPSIDKSRVWARLKCEPFNFSDEIANTIAGLCSIRVKSDSVERFVLPQGAPTSPLLTNAICDTLDRRLGALAKRFGMRYSRYADDITFSSMHFVYGNDGNFIKELKRIITSQNFTINEKKTRLQILGKSRQEVTGLTISDKVNVARKYFREIKTLLNIWDHYGYIAACESYIKTHCGAERGQCVGMPKLEAVLAGKLQYMKMVKGSDDPAYQKLQTRFNVLKSRIEGKDASVDKDVAYLHTIGRASFLRLVKNGEVVIDSASKVFYKQNEQQCPVVVSRGITSEELTSIFEEKSNDATIWDKYRISLCESGRTQFYMLHKNFRDRKYKPCNNSVKLEDIGNIFTNSKLIKQDNQPRKCNEETSNILKRIAKCVKKLF